MHALRWVFVDAAPFLSDITECVTVAVSRHNMRVGKTNKGQSEQVRVPTEAVFIFMFFKKKNKFHSKEQGHRLEQMRYGVVLNEPKRSI